MVEMEIPVEFRPCAKHDVVDATNVGLQMLPPRATDLKLQLYRRATTFVSEWLKRE
jgi:hypothetical protein